MNSSVSSSRANVTRTPVDSGATTGVSADSINKMDGASFEAKLGKMTDAGIADLLNNSNITDERKQEALLALANRHPQIVDTTNNQIGDDDETAEEKLQKLLKKLSDKVVRGEKMSAGDTQELQAAMQAVDASQTTTSASK